MILCAISLVETTSTTERHFQTEQPSRVDLEVGRGASSSDSSYASRARLSFQEFHRVAKSS